MTMPHNRPVKDEEVLAGFASLHQAMATGFDAMQRRFGYFRADIHGEILDVRSDIAHVRENVARLEQRILRRFDEVDSRLDNHEERIATLEA